MSKKVLFPLIAVFTFGVAAGSLGCHAEANVGETTPKAATPPPPEPTPPPAPPPPAPEPPPAPPKTIKPMGKAKIENGQIKIPGKIHFEVDKAVLKEDKETKEILQTVADVMRENAHITKVHVEGYTDDSGAKDHNMKLSQERADAVITWLSTKGSIDKSRLEGKGYGPDRAVAKNDTAPNKEMNRRVEFKLWELEGKPTDQQKNEASGGGAMPSAGSAAPADTKGATPAAAGTAKKP